MKENNNREQKGIQIFSKTDSIKKISKNHFVVNSSSSDKQYHVRRIQNTEIFTCECADFHYRLRKIDDKRCKHIISCILLQDSILSQSKIEKTEQPKICSKCYSTTITKNGFRKVKNGTERQKYRCKKCTYRFILG